MLIYLLTAVGLSPGGSSTVHIYTQTVHRTIQNKQYIEQPKNFGECGPCPVLASYTLAFALQLRKKHGKTSVRVATSVRVEIQLITNKSLFVASSWFLLHLIIKDTRSFEHKVRIYHINPSLFRSYFLLCPA